MFYRFRTALKNSIGNTEHQMTNKEKSKLIFLNKLISINSFLS